MSETYLFAFKNVIEHNLSIEIKIKILKECLDSGIDINRNNSQILIDAIQSGESEIIDFVIDNGVNIRADNDASLICACEDEITYAVKRLLELGADPCAQNNTPILSTYEPDIVKLLIEFGVNPFIDSNKIFCEICSQDKSNIIKYLISIGANCAEPNNMPISDFIMGESCDKNILELLLENGADPNTILINGLSLLEYSVSIVYLKFCKILFKYGATANSCQNIINGKYDYFETRTMASYNLQKMEQIKELCLEHGLDITNAVNKIKVRY